MNKEDISGHLSEYSAVQVPLSFTLSVTGHRNLASSKLYQPLIDTVDEILCQIALLCNEQSPAVKLRFNTALAAGADQIAALATGALDKNAPSGGVPWSLQVILPFERHSYKAELYTGLNEGEDGFLHAERDAFSTLLGAAEQVYELADRKLEINSEDESGVKAQYWQNTRYRTLGEILVRQADILLALWDGQPGGGKGGTADVVGIALQQGKPVLWINTNKKSPLSISWLMPSPGTTDPMTLAAHPTLGPTENVRSLFNEKSDVSSLSSEKSDIAKFIGSQLMLPIDELDKSDSGGKSKPSSKPKVFSSARAFFGSSTFGLHANEPVSAPESASTSRHDLLEFDSSSFWQRAITRYPWLKQRLAGYSFPEKTGPTTGWFLYQWLVESITKSHLVKTDAFSGEPVTQSKPEGSNASDNQANSQPFHLRVKSSVKGMRLKVNYAEDDWRQNPYDPEDGSVVPGRDSRPTQIDHADSVLCKAMTFSDAIATARGHTYRSSYVLNFLGGAIAVWVGLVGLLFSESKHVFVSVEVLFLLLLFGLFILARSRSWHHRWLNARHISESLRAGRFLVWLGLSGRRSILKGAPWGVWYSNAVMSAASMPNARLEESDIRYMASELRSHVRDQVVYHHSNAEKLEMFHHRLDKLSQWCLKWTFVFAILFVVLKLSVPDVILKSYGFGIFKYLVTIVCAGMPVVAGALIAIGFQGDFERFAERSSETKRQLGDIDNRLAALLARQPDRSDQPLFEELSRIVTDMLEVYEKDLEDWKFVYAARPSLEPA